MSRTFSSPILLATIDVRAPLADQPAVLTVRAPQILLVEVRESSLASLNLTRGAQFQIAFRYALLETIVISRT
jgi:hypothetical protein